MWKETNNQLTKTFSFHNFRESFAFATQVATLAERIDHHPEININWDKVTLTLSTHSQSNTLTKLDYELAGKIDAIE